MCQKVNKSVPVFLKSWVVRATPIVLCGLVTTGCYTLHQGTAQAKLLLKRRPIAAVLAEGTESADRLAKLRLVDRILKFAASEITLTPGGSYQTYVSLPGPSVTYVVQAASKRSLTQKTWWFPIVGSQPYLGFFDESDAKAQQAELVAQGFDTSMGGVEAFSLLGYFSDPVYSSMLDGNDVAEFVELLLHESLHRTIYVPNDTIFNENLADFVAKKATIEFFNKNSDLKLDIKNYEQKFQKIIVAQSLFKPFLVRVKKELEDFYAMQHKTPEAEFLVNRQNKFDEIASRYDAEIRPYVQGTGYAFSFRKGKINNASVLGMSLYESKQQPLSDLFDRCNGSLPKMLQQLQSCLKSKGDQDIWSLVSSCQ